MTDFLTADTSLPSYMMFPRFLLDMEINETAKMLYIILLDRARLSQKNEGWSDTNGHVFLYFTIEALAEVLHKSQMTVKTALAVLEKQELIFRKRQGPGHPNRIYVKIPKETLSNTDRILSSRQTENCPIDRQDSFPDTDRKLSSNKKEIKKNHLTIRGSKEPRSPYGKLKAKVTEKKELNVQKSKTSILNPFQHIKLNQQLTTVTEEIEELKSVKEQLLFQAECSTEKDMASLSRKYDQMDKNLDILDSQDMSLKGQLKKDAVAFQEEKFRPDPEQYTELLDARIQIRPTFRDKLIEQLKGTFGEYYDYHRRDIAANEVDYLNVEDPDVFSHRAWELEYQRKQEMRRNQPVRTKKKSHDIEL